LIVKSIKSLSPLPRGRRKIAEPRKILCCILSCYLFLFFGVLLHYISLSLSVA